MSTLKLSSLFLILTINFCFSQKESILLVQRDYQILQGVVSFESVVELYVGQEYYFTITVNDVIDMEIQSENLSVKLDENSKKRTSGLFFTVTPLDTGECKIWLSAGRKADKMSGLLLKSFHATHYPMPPVYIANVRSGDIINELNESPEISCKYAPESGIFESYPIKSWSAKLGSQEYSAKGNVFSSDLVNAVNTALPGEVLKVTVELEKNATGFKKSEALFLLK
jgi:hypothetical protein